MKTETFNAEHYAEHKSLFMENLCRTHTYCYIHKPWSNKTANNQNHLS